MINMRRDAISYVILVDDAAVWTGISRQIITCNQVIYELFQNGREGRYYATFSRTSSSREYAM
jgi:hypothetical protein